MNIISGIKCAKDLLDKAEQVVKHMQNKYKITPTLHIIMLGNHHASQIYVKNKLIKAKQIGMKCKVHNLKKNSSDIDIITKIQQCNEDLDIHGVIVQLPLPQHINSKKVLNHIKWYKDVDGLTSTNIGNFVNNHGEYIIPCTPLACLNMIKSVIGDVAGTNSVVVGRSNLVGTPLALLLTSNDSTCTLCHQYTKNLEEITKKADIVVSAIGKAHFFSEKFFSNNSIVIDVGINRLNNTSQIVGDVQFETVKNHVKYISPVPKGVGPVTVAYLLANTIKAACLMYNDDKYKCMY